MPRGAGPADGPRRSRGPHPGAGPPPREGPPRAPVGRAGLRRAVVLAAQAGSRRLLRRVPAPRDRRGPPASATPGRCMVVGPAQPGRVSTTTASPPTTPPTPSATRTPRASSACGASAWPPGRPARWTARYPAPGAMTLWHGRLGAGGTADVVMDYSVSLRYDRRLAARRPGRVAGPRPGPGRGGLLTGEEVAILFAALDQVERGAGRGDVRLRRRATRTSTRRSSAGSPRSPATWGPSCTPAGAATTRSPPTSASTPSGSCSAVARRGARAAGRPAATGPRTPGDDLPARLHPPAAGPAGAPGPPPAGPRLGPGPRRRPAGRHPSAGSTCRPSGPAPWPARPCPSTPTVAGRPRVRGRFENSLDAVSDRDFVAEALFDLALLGVHLSRIGRGDGAVVDRGVRLRRSSTTPSPPAARCCPRRRTPTSPSWPAASAGRLIGNLTGLLATLKGLPAGLQPRPPGGQGAALRLARPDRRRRWRRCPGCWPPLTFVHRPHAGGRRRPVVAAVDLAEWLVQRGMPFRQAHAVVGGLVRDSLERHVPLVELVGAHPQLGAEAVPLLEPGVAVTRRTTPGGAGPGPGGRATPAVRGPTGGRPGPTVRGARLTHR